MSAEKVEAGSLPPTSTGARVSADPPRFFLHFLNREVLRLYETHPVPGSGTQLNHVLALTRIALFLSDYPLLVPPASLFELPYAGEFLKALEPAAELQLLEYVSPSPDLEEYAAKKQREYRDQQALALQYSATRPDVGTELLDRLVWRPRRRLSASVEIGRAWLRDLTHPGGVGWALLEARPSRGNLEALLASVPTRLDGRAFIPMNVGSLLPSDATVRERSAVALLISSAYVMSFLEEYSAAVLVDTPLGLLDCDLPKAGQDGKQLTYSYRSIRDALRMFSLYDAIAWDLPLSELLEVKYSAVGSWFREAVVLEGVSGRLRLPEASSLSGLRRSWASGPLTELRPVTEYLSRVRDELGHRLGAGTESSLRRPLPSFTGRAVIESATRDTAWRPDELEGGGVGRGEELSRAAQVAVVVALPKELAAAQVVFGASVKWTAPGGGAGRRYDFARIGSSDGSGRVVALTMADVGNNSAAIRVTRLLEHCPNVRHVVMCGIAGGIPVPKSPERYPHLGDVVISNEFGVIQYDFVKLTGEVSEPRHRPRPPASEMLEAVRYLEAERLQGLRPWERFLAMGEAVAGGRRPDDRVDAKGDEIVYPDDPSRRPGRVEVFSAPIAASNALLKDSALRDKLFGQFGVLAVEMESSGIADATWAHERGYVTVRGICDYCDAAKGDVWQGFAAVAAAAYARALIESMPGERL